MNFLTTLFILSLIMSGVVAHAGNKPNVILIVSDDHNKSELACYGGDILTPNLDRLAQTGVLFENAYTSTTVCSPSRYTTLTGRYAGRCTHPDFFMVSPEGGIARISNRSITLERGRPNLMKTLQSAGYTTGITGKWHLGEWMAGVNKDGEWIFPQGYFDLGLQVYDRKDSFSDPEFIRKLQHNQKRFSEELKHDGWDYAASIYWCNPREFHHDELYNHNQEWITYGALQFIEQNKNNPFFLYMAVTIPHGPDPMETLIRGDDPRKTGAGLMTEHLEGQPSRQSIMQTVKQAGKPANSADITWMDAGVGSVINKIEELGLRDNTLIIFIADHGLPSKATLYEGGTQVPMIVSWPGKIEPRRETRFVQNIDITPTIMDFLNIPKAQEHEIDGRSLRPLLEANAPEDWRDDLYFEYGYSRAIRCGQWKYIAVRYPPEVVVAYRNGEITQLPYLGFNISLGKWQSGLRENYWTGDQLYNLEQDPDEKLNLAYDERYQDILVDMRKRLARHLAQFPDRPFAEFTPLISGTAK